MKKRTEESRGITLGIDIGTQFTYIGYIEDGMFKSALPSECIYGISSTVAFKKTAINSTTYSINADHILYGKAADDKLSKDKDFFKLATNIKEAVRGGIDTFSEQNVKFDADILLENYLKYIFDQYLSDALEGKKITQVAIAYPNGTQSEYVGKYKKVLTEKINNVMNKSIEKKKGEKIIVSINPEAAMAADLIAKLYFAQKKQEGEVNYNDINDIMVIDIGAGTSDIGIAHWNNNNKKYEIEGGYQASVDFGGLIIDRLLTNSQVDGQYIVDPISSPEQLIDYKRWIYGDDGSPIAGLSQEDCQRMIAENKQPFQEQLEKLKDGIENCYKSYRKQYPTSYLEIVVLGNTSTIPPVASMINYVFENKNDRKVHFLDDKKDELSGALRKKGVTNSNFMAFACAFVGGGFDTDNHGLVSEAEKKEDSGREGDGIGENTKMVVIPTIHGAGADSILAIQVLHNHKYPHFKAWDLISSPLAHEGKQYFLVGPYVDSLENSSKTQFTPVIVNRLKLKDNSPILYAEDDNPNRNFLITEFTDKYNIPKCIDGKDYYTYEKNCKANESCLSGIEIVGRGHSCDETFKVDKGCYVGVIYDYNPATPVDKKLQIYYWEKTNAAYKGGVCYYDEDNQKAIDFETFRNEAKKDGRCNLYD